MLYHRTGYRELFCGSMEIQPGYMIKYVYFIFNKENRISTMFILTNPAEAIIIPLAAINLAGLVITGFDKRRAKLHKWRIPEKAFFIISIFGGALGIYTGLLLFRHKTRHPSFMLGIPVIFLLELAAACFLFFR